MSQTEQATESKSESKAPPKQVELPADLPQRVEAALLTTDRAMSAAKLAGLFEGATVKVVTEAIDELNKTYNASKRSFRIEEVAGGYQMLTLPEYSGVLDALQKTRAQTRLTAASLETLAIIAYKQPILRVDVEAVRGVACGEVIRTLMDMHLVKIVGRAETLGRPMLYGTTKFFLETFGLADLKDLPKVEELKVNVPEIKESDEGEGERHEGTEARRHEAEEEEQSSD
jgi:segregation and condensation protein B